MVRIALPRPAVGRWTAQRTVLVALAVVALALGVVGQVHQADAQVPHAEIIELETIIHPIGQRYLERALDKAAENGAVVVVVEIDTPGGLLSSTRKIVSNIFASRVPVIVYVSPSGARAASAGTFITAAGHIAAMAPGTNIGAASPIAGDGTEIPETLKSKLFEDTAAEIRSIAERRGRAIEPLEATVLEAKAYTAEEALKLGIIDLIAESVTVLLREVDGMVVQVDTELGQQPVTLETADLDVRRVQPGFFDKLLSLIADPNISFLLISLGGLGLFVEILNPGLIFPGITGGIALVLGFVALGNLPGNWAGAALILLAFALAIAEVNVDGFGLLGILGAVSFVFGGILLFGHFGTPSPTFPDIEVSPKVLVPIAIGVGALSAFVMVGSISGRRTRRRIWPATTLVVGMEGVVTAALDPRGTIRVRGESWTAESKDRKPLEPGTPVTVVTEEGALLTVERTLFQNEIQDEPDAANDA